MRVLIAGSSGFLGRHLVARLRAEGHDVTTLVRRPPERSEVRWDPYAADAVAAAMGHVAEHDVVVNLAGAPLLGNPHSKKWAEAVRHSRVTTTRVLAEAIAAAGTKPAFLAGNGISWYGDHGSDALPEDAESLGSSLLTEVSRAWQEAAQPAVGAGGRVVILRTAPVLDRTSPPLRQLRLLFGAGLGGPIGSGRQFFPVISRRDWIGAVVHLVTSGVSGPANLCCPHTPTNSEFTHALARQLHRPAFLRVPAPAVKLAAGPMAAEVLGSLRAVPQVLQADGYEFADPDVTAVLGTALRD
jgi:uncharacterized protein (TIGR01777 family)